MKHCTVINAYLLVLEAANFFNQDGPVLSRGKRDALFNNITVIYLSEGLFNKRIEKCSPGKFVLREHQYFTLQYTNNFFLVIQSTMFQHMLNDIVPILILQEWVVKNSNLFTKWFITWINLSVEACSSIRIGSVCSAVQFSRMRCITLQPYGCVAKSNTCPQKALMIN